MNTRPVLIAGEWRPGAAAETFRAVNPLTGEVLDDAYPVSTRRDIDAALEAGSSAARELLDVPASARAAFLDAYAGRLEERAREITEMAHEETALPLSTRLAGVELPRTANQLRQAAAAVRDGSWVEARIDTALDIRSRLGPLGGPVAVFGPNNFPLAFNAVAGGDFAAAIAAGNPVIAKAHTSHPGTSRLLAEEALEALRSLDLPAATVQMLYRMRHKDGEYLVSHPLAGATGYTGARETGLVLKAAADRAGKPIYLELSSINPVFVLPGALRERAQEIATEYTASVLLGSGQFCTNPGVLVLMDGDDGGRFVADVRRRLEEAEPGPLLNDGVASRLLASIEALRSDGAELVTGGERLSSAGFRCSNTLLAARGEVFLARPRALQREAFGNAGLIVRARDEDQLIAIARTFEGNLTGSVYTHTGGDDDPLYDRLAEHLRRRVGRLLNDKMPTGVAVSPAMNHGGPFPATGHPGFTAVGMPSSIRRFAMLECYDNVRQGRLPPELRDRNPTGTLWRMIDGDWTQRDA